MECDNAFLVKTIFVGEAVSSRMMELQFIHLFLIRSWRVRFRHIPRSQNEVVDQMAKCTFNGGVGLISFEEPPTSACDLLLEDKFNRL